MKKTIQLSCLVLTIMLNKATAQVSKSDFTSNVNFLNGYITQKNTGGESTTYSQLAEFMTNEIHYLKNIIITSTATYTADSTKAGADLRAANRNNNIRQRSAALQESQRVQAELSPINKYKSNLSTDSALFASIRTLATNMSANQNNLISDLNLFAATL